MDKNVEGNGNEFVKSLDIQLDTVVNIGTYLDL